MGTRANVERRPGKRSVIGSILGSILLAGLVAMAELVATAFAPLGSPAQALARSVVDGFIILERQIGRGGSILGYPIQF
jgi:Mn2+/Fe2+ NRAMP family transporter